MLETIVMYLELLFVVLGIVILTYGIIDSTLRWLLSLLKREKLHLAHKGRETIRAHLGTFILLSLEFFIAADLLRTILKPSWEEVGLLAGIVAIRTVLSVFLNIEMKYFK